MAMKANVSRGYRWWVACHGKSEVSYSNECLDHPFEIIEEVEDGYQLKDFERVIHPFVPAEFVTIIEE